MQLSKLLKYSRSGYFLLRNHRDNRPFFIAIEITGDCNRRCVYCSFGGNSCKSEDLDYKEWRRIISYFTQKHNASYISFVGGEPFLRKELLFQLVADTSRKAITSVITNGVLVANDDLKKLKELGLDSICFSIHYREDFNRNTLLAIEAKKLDLITLLSVVVYSQGMELYRDVLKSCIKHNLIFCFNLCQQFNNSPTASNLIKNIITPENLSEVI